MDTNIIGNFAAINVQNNPVVTTSTSGVQPAAQPVVAVPDLSGSGVGNAITGSAGTPSLAQVKQAVDKINASLSENGYAQNVQFAVDPSSKRVVVQVVDPQTEKVIRQIPSEEIIQMSLVLGQKLGQIINQQA